MRRKHPPAPNPATHRSDLDLPGITDVVRDMLGDASTVRPFWNYTTGALEAVEVRTPKPISYIPGILDQISSRVTRQLREPWISERHSDQAATIRISKADNAALTRAGVATLCRSLTDGAASLGNPRVQPTYRPSGELEALEVIFSSGRKIADHVLSDFAARVLPGHWIPSWTGPNTLCLTTHA
jgi:hypothetical protein